MPAYRVVSAFGFKFRKSDQLVAAGEIVGLPVDIGRAAVEQGVVVEVDPELARREAEEAKAAEIAASLTVEESNNEADESKPWPSRKRKKE